MQLRRWPARKKDLACATLVLAPGGRRRDRLLRGAALLAAMVAGAAGSHVYWSGKLARWREDTVPMNDFRQAEQARVQTGLQLQMSVARGRELEQQVDGLNQRLRACLEEVSFFREGRGAKH
jgi:hypothetical protein